MVPPTSAPAAPAPGPQAPPQTFRVELKRRYQKCRVKFDCIPPEEFLISRKARSIENAVYVAHRTYTTVGDLVSMGYDEDVVSEYAGSPGGYLDSNEEAIERDTHTDQMWPLEATADPTSRLVYYVEHYIKLDMDGDGIAELRQICTVGENHKILRNCIINGRPFSVGCPDPEPHRVIGNSIAEMIADVQRVKSNLIRQMLDSLGESINPRTTVVEGAVNVSDVLNNKRGAIIRQTAPGMVQEFSKEFVGPKIQPVLGYYDEMRESRVGITKAAAGLDADVLQSTTKAAVSATVSAAHARIELIARTLAETMLKPLMRGLLQLICQHQDQPRMLRLRNKWVPVDPSAWNSDMDVIVNVGIGTGTLDERKQALMAIAARQEAILQAYGPQNPLVSVHQYGTTLGKLVELAGYKDTHQFFNDVPPDWQPPPQPPHDPATILANVQAEQIKADMAIKAEQMKLDQWKASVEDDRKRDELDADIVLRSAEIQAKYGSQVDVATIQALIDRDRNAMNSAVAMAQAHVQHQGNQMNAAVQHAANMTQAAADHHAALAQTMADHNVEMQGAAVDHAANQRQADIQEAQLAQEPAPEADAPAEGE